MQTFRDDQGELVNAVFPDTDFDEPPEPSHFDAFEAIRKVLILIIESPNPALQAELLCLLFGIGYQGCTEQKIASRYCYTRAAISRRLISLRDKIGIARCLGPTRGETTRGKCRDSRIKASLK